MSGHLNPGASQYEIIFVTLDGSLQNHRRIANVGLACLEAFLREHGVHCRTIHAAEIDNYITQAETFGISVMDHTYGIAKLLSQRLQNKRVIWGGWTATALPEYILQEIPNVDYVILREGEQRLLDLLRSFRQPDLFDQMDGIAYRNERGQVVVRPPQRWMNLDDLPIPTELATLNQLVFVELARGCYGRCGYCQEVHSMRFKSVPRVLAEIEHWYAQGYRHFYFGDANSIANGKQLAQVTAAWQATEREIRIFLTGRPSDILRNYEILKAIFASPFTRVHSVEVGVEANTEHALQLLGRRSTLEVNRQAVAALLELKNRYSPQTQVHANIILFSHPDLTLDDLIGNIRFLGDFQCSREVLSLQLYGVANTPIWFELKAKGCQPCEERGMQIMDYAFADPTVERIFAKLVRTPLLYAKQRQGFSYFDQQEFQHHVHDRLLECYRAPDLAQALLDFANA